MQNCYLEKLTAASNTRLKHTMICLAPRLAKDLHGSPNLASGLPSTKVRRKLVWHPYHCRFTLPLFKIWDYFSCLSGSLRSGEARGALLIRKSSCPHPALGSQTCIPLSMAPVIRVRDLEVYCRPSDHTMSYLLVLDIFSKHLNKGRWNVRPYMLPCFMINAYIMFQVCPASASCIHSPLSQCFCFGEKDSEAMPPSPKIRCRLWIGNGNNPHHLRGTKARR